MAQLDTGFFGYGESKNLVTLVVDISTTHELWTARPRELVTVPRQLGFDKLLDLRHGTAKPHFLWTALRGMIIGAGNRYDLFQHLTQRSPAPVRAAGEAPCWAFA